MTKSKTSLFVAFGLALFISLMYGAVTTTTTWNGGDGNWDDSTKWSNGVPSSDTPGEVRFKTKGVPYTVTLNHPVTNQHFVINAPASGVATAPITLAGSGTITNTWVEGIVYAFETEERTSFILDGPTMQNTGATNIRGEFEIKSGTFTQSGTLYPTRTNSHIKVSGGYMYAPILKLSEKDGASYTQTGGYAWFPSFMYGASNTITVTGGTIRRPSLQVPRVTQDWRGVTNIVNDLQLKGGTNADEIAYYSGPCVVIGQYLTCTRNSYAGFPLGITFGSCGNWYLTQAAKLTIRERFHVDTSDFFDPTVSHTVNMTSSKEMKNGAFDFAVYGGGTFKFALNDLDILSHKIDGFTLGEGTSMTMIRTDKDYHRRNNILPQKMKLGSGSTISLMMKYNYFDSSDTAEIGDGVTLNVRIFNADTEVAKDHSYADKRYPVFIAGPTGSVENLTINLIGEDTEYWTVRKLLNSAWVDDGTTDMTPNPNMSAEWCGGADGNLSTAANWSKGVAQVLTGGYVVVFNTMQGVITNDVDNMSVARLTTTNSCGPVLMRGKPVTAKNNYRRSLYSTIGNFGMFPFVLENDVIGPASTANFGVTVGSSRYNTSTYVAFMGKLTVNSPVLDICGHVIIGGEATANSIAMSQRYAGTGRRTLLEVLSGASMTVANQTNTFSNASDTSLRVNEGGVMSFTGGKFDNRTSSKHRVFGLMDINVPLSARATLSFAGSGRVYVASTKSSPTAAKVKIGEGIRFCPKSWATLTTDGVAPITIYADARATLGAKADWTYGPAAGVTTATTPAERALVTEDVYAPLTIDTTDPDTGEGHTITFADPILAASDVEVKGVGAVCFASGEDSFGKKLSFDGNATLVLTPAQRQAMIGRWTAILTAEKIEGVPLIADGVSLRIEDNGDGTQSLMCRVPGGMMFTIR